MMVVEDAEQVPADAMQRLQSVATTDGYELAEIDLLQRGFGEVDGQAQTGQSRTLFRLIKLAPRTSCAAGFAAAPPRRWPSSPADSASAPPGDGSARAVHAGAGAVALNTRLTANYYCGWSAGTLRGSIEQRGTL